MGDDPFDLPDWRLPAVKPRPLELLWTVGNGQHNISCELRYHAEYGVEAQFLRDGEFFSGRRFPTRALAIQWAELEKGALTKDGYLALTIHGGPSQ